MKVSLIIPTRNKLPRLKLTLTSINFQNYNKDDYEVIIIDNNSNDGTEEYIIKKDFPFNLIYEKHNIVGRASSRNRGIELAKNPIIIFIDDDVILSKSFIAEHAKCQFEKPAVIHGKIYNITYLKFFQDPSKGILYEYFINQNININNLRKKCIDINDISNNFNKITQGSKITAFEHIIQEIYRDKLVDLYWVGFTGGNVSVPRDWLINVGLFDENFGEDWGFEDTELGYRLWKSDYNFMCLNNSPNYHISHFRFNFDKQNTSTSNYFYKKHNDINIKLLKDFSENKLTRMEFIEAYKKI